MTNVMAEVQKRLTENATIQCGKIGWANFILLTWILHNSVLLCCPIANR